METWFQGYMFGNAEDRLQNDAQTVVNFLSDGAVVDAIMSIERKPTKSAALDDDDDEDSHIKKIDVTNPQSTFLRLTIRFCCPLSIANIYLFSG